MKNDAIYGAIAGDVIGSSYEFKGARIEPIEFFKYDCRFTDDTVLTLAVADWLTEQNSDVQEKLLTWAQRYPRIGFGPSFAHWIVSEKHNPYNSCGNGSAMRASAIGCYATNESEVLELSKISALPTHNHPEGVKGAQAVALAIFLARQGVTKEEIRTKIATKFNYNLNRTFEDLYSEKYEFHVLCQNTVPEALICFLDSNGYEDCIIKAMLTNKDTDTAACIAGSIAAAYYGIPEKIKNQLNDYLPQRFKDVIERIH